MFPCNFGASIFHFEFQYGYCCFCHLELITGSYNFFFFKFSSVMAGLAEGSQFDARQFDARMNDL